MAHTTVTLTANGRLPGALSGTPTSSTDVVISSGIVAIMPHVTSGFTCYRMSALGYGYKQGRIGVPSGAGEPSGAIIELAVNTNGKVFCSVGNMERNTGQTFIPKGGGTGTN